MMRSHANRRFRSWCALPVGAALLGASALNAQISFTEVADDVGLGVEFYASPHIHGLGVAWIDFNADGWPDLIATNGYGFDVHLYQNNGGTFTLVDELLPALPTYETMAAIFADYDNDGDQDIYLITDNELLELNNPNNPTHGPPNMLLKNLWVENGNALSEPLFVDVTEAAGVSDTDPKAEGEYNAYRAATGSWVDYDRDGWLDLFVGHWAAAHPGEPYVKDRLYRNNQNGTFTDVTEAAGIHVGEDPTKLRSTLAMIAAHLDDDLWPDLYVSNFIDDAPYHYDFHYRNNKDGTFSDVTSLSPGVGDDAISAMGITVGDIELDGDWDLYITDIYALDDAGPVGNPLYLGNGDGTFADNSADIAGLQAANSWGVHFIDADHDRYEDLFVATMGALTQLFYSNDHDATFTDISAEAGFAGPTNSRGSAMADYDADGDLDIVVNIRNSSLRLYQNNTANAGHWLQVDLNAIYSNRDAIGTLVQVTAGGETMMRQVLGATSGHGQDSLVPHFGLGEATSATSVVILWPSGIVDTLLDVPADQVVTVTECETQLDDCSVGPREFSAFRGFYGSGDLDSLSESDDDKLCYNPGIVLFPNEAPITLDFTTILPVDSPSTLDVTIESSANTVGLGLTFSFWNFNTNSWDVVGTDTQSLNADTVRTFAGNPADHVEPGTGEVRTRYEVRQAGIIFIFPWTDCVDQVFWTFS